MGAKRAEKTLVSNMNAAPFKVLFSHIPKVTAAVYGFFAHREKNSAPSNFFCTGEALKCKYVLLKVRKEDVFLPPNDYD